MPKEICMIIIAGGSSDHNIGRVADAVAARGYDHAVIHTDAAVPLRWRFNAEAGLWLDDADLSKGAHSLFIRYDVFQKADSPFSAQVPSAMRSVIASNWHDAIKGWALASPNVRVLNHESADSDVNKIRNMVYARELGFDLPRTWVSNDLKAIPDPENWIVKPASGGEHTRLLRDVLNASARKVWEAELRPWIVQEKLAYPELRIFKVGAWFFSFRIMNNSLDSRANLEGMAMEAVPTPSDLMDKMTALTRRLGLDYAAADFKTCPKTGILKFLEINTMPMLTGYDNVCGGQLSDALAIHLKKLQPSKP